MLHVHLDNKRKEILSGIREESSMYNSHDHDDHVKALVGHTYKQTFPIFRRAQPLFQCSPHDLFQISMSSPLTLRISLAPT